VSLGSNCRFCLDHYRGYHISYWAKPIPIRTCDYDFVHDDYDPTPEDSYGPMSDHRCGSAASIEAAKAAIDELEDE
jgi:hypothetical protein